MLSKLKSFSSKRRVLNKKRSDLCERTHRQDVSAKSFLRFEVSLSQTRGKLRGYVSVWLAPRLLQAIVGCL